MNQKKEPIIRVIDLIHVYKGKVETVALPGISFKINKGEKVAIRGKSGLGKTTLLHCLAGILKPTAGKILVEGRNIVDYNEDQLAEYRCKKVGLVYQSFNLAPFLTIEENIEFPMVLAKKERRERKERINELVELLDIQRYLNQKPAFLSGGEQQRVAIAVALANNPDIILADEPTGNLDLENSQVVYQYLSDLCDHFNKTLLIATHDPEASKYTEREIILTKLKSQEL
ncbi:MAG: ABC transporter ATP-binding protein [Candidatus Heimdallarchaeum endolithica]|uniref:ABC transporter ATP-binding protein n=1 Tax=Candidatus Heimdallarchaeum endolithica TaxID=2876572 RepID=A0A9Y1BQV0_9ARCH|nr:MAG: ABC transporter ATP-binding protein [Candidatus Heimdallarchaeum endolithica]